MGRPWEATNKIFQAWRGKKEYSSNKLHRKGFCLWSWDILNSMLIGKLPVISMLSVEENVKYLSPATRNSTSFQPDFQ